MIKGNFLFLFLFLIPIHSFAYETFCFQRGVNLNEVKKHVLAITSPRDKVFLQERTHCLEIQMNSSKRDLIQKWISKRYTVVNNRGAGALPEPVFEPCRLSVEKIMKEKSNEKQFSVGQRNRLQETELKGSGKSVSSLVLGKGSDGTIRVNDQKVDLMCTQSGQQAYQVKISLSSLSQAISTQVRVVKGQRVDLGAVVENLNREATLKGIPLGFVKNKKSGRIIYQYFLLAK